MHLSASNSFQKSEARGSGAVPLALGHGPHGPAAPGGPGGGRDPAVLGRQGADEAPGASARKTAQQPWVSMGFLGVLLGLPGCCTKNTRSFSFTLAWSASVKWKAVKKFVCLLHMYIQTCVCLKMAPPKLVFPAMGFQEVPPNHPRGVARSPRKSPKQTNLGNLFFGGRGVFCGFREKLSQLCPEGLFCRVPFWGVLTGTQKVKPAFWRSP